MIKYKLPDYPCQYDVWDVLSKEIRPIVVYGMGNGADKLFRRFEKYGIKVSEVFASDGFVRGHSFRGYKVRSFSEIKAEYPEFVIVLSFASNRKEVIEMFAEIDREYDLYIPDMPVAGEEEYFDREYFNSNYGRIKASYDLLEDEKSKSIYAAAISYKLTGRLEYLIGVYTEREEMYSLISRRDIKTVVDAGAYNGDTAKEVQKYIPTVEKIYAIEPDKRNFKKLSLYAEGAECDIECINAAVFNRCSEGMFIGSGNRNSSISSTASYEHESTSIPLITVDSLGASADYIKYDVEGAEYEALLGSLETIKRERPVLLVSLYHRSRDVFAISELLSSELREYSYYITRLPCVPAWELNIILVPNEINRKGNATINEKT